MLCLSRNQFLLQARGLAANAGHQVLICPSVP